MKLIVLIAGALSMGLGACAVVVGDPLVGSLLFIAPLACWAFVLIRDRRRKDNEAFAVRLAEAQKQHDEYVKTRRVDAEAEYARAVARSQHAALSQQSLQQQQMQMFAAQQAAREQRAAMAQQRPSGMSYGFSDPRAQFAAQQQAQQNSSNFLMDMVTANAINSALNDAINTGTGVTKTSYDHDTDTVKVERVDPIQFHSFVNSGLSEPPSSSSSSSSSSSYSSDTSSDSFGGSDTSSDSF